MKLSVIALLVCCAVCVYASCPAPTDSEVKDALIAWEAGESFKMSNRS